MPLLLPVVLSADLLPLRGPASLGSSTSTPAKLMQAGRCTTGERGIVSQRSARRVEQQYLTRAELWRPRAPANGTARPLNVSRFYGKLTVSTSWFLDWVKLFIRKPGGICIAAELLRSLRDRQLDFLSGSGSLVWRNLGRSCRL